MKTSKNLFIIPALAAVLLTGCSVHVVLPEDMSALNGGVSSPAETSAAEPVSDIGTAESNANIPEETFLIGLDGKSVYLSDIKAVNLSDGTVISGEDLSLDKFSKDNFSAAECEGFCYLAEPDPDAGEINRNPQYKRYNVGDKYGDLTVKKATVSFDARFYNTPCFGSDPELAGKDIDFPAVFYNDQYVEFEGEVKVKGYMLVNENSDYFPEYDGVMNLIVDYDCTALPIAEADISFGADGGFFTMLRRFTLGDYGEDDHMETFSHYSIIRLGNINEAAVDTSGLNTDYRHYSEVNVTLENVVMPVFQEQPKGSSHIQAEIKELEILS